MNKLEATTKVATFVVGISTTFVVKRAITTVAQPETTLQQAEAFIGAWVIGGMVAQATESYVEKQINDAAVKWTELKAKFQEAKQN